MPPRLVCLALLAALCVAGAGCSGANDAFCCSSIDSCSAKGAGAIVTCGDPTRPYCDDTGEYGPSNTCIPDPITSVCSRAEDCTTPARPVCDVDGTGTCVRCQGSPDCTRFAPQSLCEPISGGCVECLMSSDCMATAAPVCGADHACRACQQHDECGSGVCNKMTGACVLESQVVYVDAGGSGSACSRAMPCPTIAIGVAATDATRRYILVAPGSYSELVAVDGRAFTLIGEGADLSATTVGPLLDVRGGSNITIEGLRIHGGAGASGDGVRCSDSGGAATVALRSVRLEDNGGRGVNSANCTLTVAASRVFGNNEGGLDVSGGAVTVRNNFVAKNGDPGTAVGGVSLDTPSMLTFEFNTVADNAAANGFAAGVQCASIPMRTLSSNIVVGQGADQVSATNCEFSYTISNEPITGVTNTTTPPTFVDAPNNDFHLQGTSAGVDGADPGAVLATDIDGESRPEPAGGRADIGADEVH